MDKIAVKLTVLFDDPFWIGLYERESDGKYELSKVTFGAEPRDYEVYAFLLQNWGKLRFSPSLDVSAISEKSMNPKRMQRLIRKQTQNTGIGTKAQQALKQQQEQCKLERKMIGREKREAEKELQFSLRQKKHREKHKGH